MDAAQSVFGGAFSFAYDAGGNMTSSLASGSNLSTFGYDGDNHLVSRTGAGGNFTYTYDGNGTLVKRTDTGSGAWTVYIGGIYEVTNAGGVTKYYSALGRTVAMRQAGALYWLLADHLGSNSVVTDGVGLVVGSVKYGPYGGVRSATGSMPTDRLYTSQRQEAGDALGLYDYKARFYSTVLGRFLGVDPMVSDSSNPQSLNPYSNVRNRPESRHDPSGLCDPEDPDCHFYQPKAGEDASGHSFVHDGTCDDTCGALVYLKAIHDDPNLLGAFSSWVTAVTLDSVSALPDLGDGSAGPTVSGAGGSLMFIHAWVNDASYEYWSKQPTQDIVDSLRSGDQPLRVATDGRIMNGNTRLRVLEERGIDVTDPMIIPRGAPVIIRSESAIPGDSINEGDFSGGPNPVSGAVPDGYDTPPWG